METCVRRCVLTLVALACGVPAFAQTPAGTAFTYQGQLKDGGAPVSGVRAFEFRLYDAATYGAQVGTTVSLPGVVVSGGLFTTALDFGADAFGGNARWLEIRVYDPSTGWATLSPRQQITPTPAALYAASAGALALPYDGNVASDDVGFAIHGSGAEGSITFAADHIGDECTAISAGVSGTDAVGLYGVATGANGVGLYSTATGTDGCAVRGYAGTDAAYAGQFTSSGISAIALNGVANGTSGRGIYGRAANASGVNYGVYGETASTHGYGGYFVGRGYFSTNLGVGVTNPVQKLEVAGTIVSTGLKLTTGAAAGYVLTSDANGVGTWQPPAGGAFWTQSADDIYYDTGYVGIGTSTPAAKLDVLGGNFDVVGTEGDLRIGTDDSRLKFGVATTGGSIGLARLRAQSISGTPKIILGAGSFDTLTVTSGNVGIGTLAPAADAKLDVSGRLKATTLQITSGAASGYVLTSDALGVATWQAPAGTTFTLPYTGTLSSGSTGIAVTNSGSGAGLYGAGGNYGVRGQSDVTAIYGFSAAGTALYGNTNTGIGVRAKSGGTGLAAPALYTQNTNATGIAIYSVNASSDANIVAANTGTGDLIKGYSGTGGGDLVFRVENDGRTTVSVLQITGGSDLAEPFEVRGGDAIEPGMVVCIDADHPGNLKLSTNAYDRTVAGVISGAGGVQTGMVMGQHGSIADGRHAVALTGRVYVYADATEHAIEPGDLLTTAARPGHAMKVTDYTRGQGAIIGKAMTRLAQGETGLVLVLVNLQ